jgi:hypothetical protein
MEAVSEVEARLEERLRILLPTGPAFTGLSNTSMVVAGNTPLVPASASGVPRLELPVEQPGEGRWYQETSHSRSLPHII